MSTHVSGPTIMLVSGKYFSFLDPESSEFTVHDVAHALSNICRFNGHCRHFYSVAQHSVLVSENLPRELAYQGLMHDAAEAFVGDMVRPLKHILPEYQAIGRRIEAVVFKRLGLPEVLDPEVKRMDLRALLTEQRDLMYVLDDWACTQGLVPMAGVIAPWDPWLAKSLFLKRYAEVQP